MREDPHKGLQPETSTVSKPHEISILRRVCFSAGHRYWLESRSEQENRRLFGRWASPYSHGHNYVLEVAYTGRPDPGTGMVANIKAVDALVRNAIVGPLEGKSLNDEVPWFEDRAPSLENVALFARAALGEASLPGARLSAIRLFETPDLYVELLRRAGTWIMTLTRCYEFAAGHRLYNESFSEEKNWELYGKDTFASGHGHNYRLEVTVSGEPDPDTGMIADIEALDQAVRELVVDRYDHRNLNSDFPEFEGKVTTCETLLQVIWDTLDGRLPAKLHRVRVAETARNSFEIERP